MRWSAVKPYVEFSSGEDINNYLLRHPEVQRGMTRRATRPKVAMVFFDEETERICSELGYELILPSDELRRRLDSKIVTTQLGNEAGAPSVPNILGRADDWYALTALSTANGGQISSCNCRMAIPERQQSAGEPRRIGIGTQTTSSGSRSR